MKLLEILKNQKGNLLMEVLVALVLIGILLSSASAFPYSLLRSTTILSNRQKALALAEKTVEGLRGAQYEDWTLVPVAPYGNPYHIVSGSSGWTISSGADISDNFRTEITFSDVFRDVNGNVSIAGTPDANTKKALVSVYWNEVSGEQSITLATFISNWQTGYGAP